MKYITYTTIHKKSSKRKVTFFQKNRIPSKFPLSFIINIAKQYHIYQYFNNTNQTIIIFSDKSIFNACKFDSTSI